MGPAGMAPDRDVAALVVADPRLWPNVRAGQADLRTERNLETGGWRDQDAAGAVLDGRIDSDAGRVTVVVDPRQEREGELRQPPQTLAGGEACDAGSDIHLGRLDRARRRLRQLWRQ